MLAALAAIAVAADAPRRGVLPSVSTRKGLRYPTFAPAPQKPHLCLMVQHDRAFRQAPSTACSMHGQGMRDITVAAPCANRELACAYGVSLLVVGGASAPAHPEWSVSPHRRLNGNQTVIESLARVCRNAELGRTAAGCAAARPPTLISQSGSPASDAADPGQPTARRDGSSRHRVPKTRPWTRHPTWNKVALLLRAPRLLPECDLLGTMDPDVLLLPHAGPLTQQPQVATWLRAPGKLIFISREPAGRWARRGAKDYHGRNDLNNTVMNAGFVLSKVQHAPAPERATAANATRAVRRGGRLGGGAGGGYANRHNATRRAHLLRRWWCGPDGSDRGALGEPLSMYLGGHSCFWKSGAGDASVLEATLLRRALGLGGSAKFT